jgi:hypothetical protein
MLGNIGNSLWCFFTIFTGKYNFFDDQFRSKCNAFHNETSWLCLNKLFQELEQMCLATSLKKKCRFCCYTVMKCVGGFWLIFFTFKGKCIIYCLHSKANALSFFYIQRQRLYLFLHSKANTFIYFYIQRSIVYVQRKMLCLLFLHSKANALPNFTFKGKCLIYFDIQRQMIYLSIYIMLPFRLILYIFKIESVIWP